MRYDTPIYFQKAKQGAYNPQTGNYDDAVVEEVEVYATVMDTQTERMRLVYGAIKQGSLTIGLQTPYVDDYDTIRIGNKRYAVDYMRKLRTKQTFIVSEVP